MYDFILETKTVVLAVALLISLIFAAVSGRGKYWWRIFIFDLTLPFAVSFYLVVLGLQRVSFRLDTISAIIFESVVFLLVARYLVLIKNCLDRVDDRSADSALKYLVFGHLMLFVPLLFLDGFGLFSEGDRNDYISKYWFAKYLIYGGFLVSSAQVPLLAARFSAPGRVGFPAWAAVGLNFVSSVLTGSKGVVFLWMLSIVALMTLSWREHAKRIAVSLALIAALMSAAFFVLLTSIDMDPGQLSELLLARFFLSNDARALAYEFSAGSMGLEVLLQEAFRGFSPVFGYVPDAVPLGVQLYRDNFGIDLDVGANASMVSLVMYYGDSDWRFLYVFFMGLVFLGLAAMAEMVSNLAKEPVLRVMSLGVFVYAARLFSQDFFAFQSILIVIVFFGMVWVVGAMISDLLRNYLKSSLDSEKLREAGVDCD
jgi:hypothetical protein